MFNFGEYVAVVVMRDVLNRFGIRGYLVGGAVRDMLLGRKPMDFDFVVELDEYKHKMYADRIASILNCRYTYNDHYHTAKFLIDGFDMDFIMARDEFYDGIAARPRVWPSNLDRDLLRRDFTINSMAYPLWEDRGGLIDPLGGQRDLQKGLIRIMHSGSFDDDPTRIFRALKYSARFGFALEGLTEKCMIDSLRDGVLEYLPGERLKNELMDIMQEENLKYLMDSLEKYNIMRYIAGCDVIINNNVLGDFGRKNIFAELFFRNDDEIIRRIRTRLNLGKSFNELCRKLKVLEEIQEDEEEFYTFLLNNQGVLKENLLADVFENNQKISNYLKFKDMLNLNNEEIKEAGQKGEGLSAAKTRKLMKLIRSEK